MLFFFLVFLQLALFAGLILFLRVILTRHVTSATTHLNQLNQDYTQKEEQAKKHMEDAERYYDETFVKAKTAAESVQASILEEAHETHDRLLEEARLKSEQILTQAEQAKKMMLKEGEDRLAAASIEKASELLQGFLPAEINKDMHSRWVEEAFRHGLDDLSRLHLPEDVREAHIVSAHALTADQKEKLQKKIKEKIHRDIRLHEQVDASLIAGFRMTLANVEIDGTLKSRVKEAAKHAKRARSN